MPVQSGWFRFEPIRRQMYVHICAKYVARSFVMQTIAIAIHGQDYVDGNVVPTFICETHRNFQKYRTTLCPKFYCVHN